MREASKFVDLLPELLEFYCQQKRQLPWRTKRPDPYRIWLSEVMSQQSTMKSLLPYYRRWVKKLPDLKSVCDCPEEELMELWAGLGYYSRVRNLKKSAKILLEFRQKKNAWPKTLEEWKLLPGVGDYTAKAVLALAFKKAYLPVDGNLTRVFSRFFGIQDPLNSRCQKKELESLIEEVAAKAHSHDHLAQALMDLGSGICRPAGEVHCSLCPLKEGCWAAKNSQQMKIPKKKIRASSEKLQIFCLAYTDPRGRVLMRQIPRGKRLEGQWELPWFEQNGEEALKSIAQGFEVRGPVSHSITRYRYKAYLVECGYWKGPLPAGHRWVEPVEKGFELGSRLSQKLAELR